MWEDLGGGMGRGNVIMSEYKKINKTSNKIES